MPRQIALLRGINLGARNRVSMPDLRELLTGLGHEDVKTLLQSGNVVLTSKETGEQLPQRGGVLTPATGIGMPLVERLRAAGMTFKAGPA